MSQQPPAQLGSGVRRQRRRTLGRGLGGYTLVELTVVLVLLIVLSGLAVPSLSRIGSAQQNVAGTRVRSALVYAQEWALGTGDTTWVTFDASNDRASVFVEDRDAIGFLNRIPMTDPLTRSPMIVQLGANGAGIEAVDIGGTSVVTFDREGVAGNASGLPLAADGTVTLSGNIIVRVNRGTGLVTVD